MFRIYYSTNYSIVQMKKVYLAALLSLTMMTANAQEPNIPRGMFGAPQVDVKFNEYKAAPQGLRKVQ